MDLIYFSDSIGSVVPPLLAVILAVVTRRVLLSLGIGIVSAALMLTQFSFENTIKYIGSTVINIVWNKGNVNSDNVNIIIFMLLLGILISLMSISGATKSFADWATLRCKTRRSVKSLTGLMAFIFFIDDFFHCLSVGAICRPITDRFKISRAKLAYLLDSTAAPMCVLMPISSWGAYIIALIGSVMAAHNVTGQSPISAFVTMIPMNLYAVFSLAMVMFVIAFNLNIGPMRDHEINAKNGQLWDASRGQPLGFDIKIPKNSHGSIIDMIFPILTLILVTIYSMVASGSEVLMTKGLTFSVIGAFEHTNVGSSLVYGAAFSLIVSILLSLRLKLNLKIWLHAVPKGIGSMLPAIVILFFAWAIGAVVRDMGTGVYLASMANRNIPIEMLPAVVFLLSCVMAFATGTSWGTFGIMLPLAGDITAASDISLLLPMLSAVLAGAVFGDHSSPISSTSILSATGAGCHHMDHVLTQLPYTLCVAFGAFLGYIAIGYTNSALAGLVVCGAWLVGFCLFFLSRNMHQQYKSVVD